MLYLTALCNLAHKSIGKDKSNTYFTNCEVYYPWFEKFVSSLLKQVGQQSRPDLALPIGAIVHALETLESDLDLAKSHGDWETVTRVVHINAAIAQGIEGSYCGNGVFLLEISTAYIDQGRYDRPFHVVIATLGHFKGKMVEHYHLTPLISVTASGIKGHFWQEQLTQVLEHEGLYHYHVYCDLAGRPLHISDLNPDFHAVIVQVQTSYPVLVGPEVDIPDEVSLNQTLRRSSVTHAQLANVSGPDANRMNRWVSVKMRGGVIFHFACQIITRTFTCL